MTDASPTSPSLETRRLAVFLAVAFGLSWATAAVISLTGGLGSDRMVLPRVPLSLVLVAGPYMFAPAVANVVARLVTNEGFERTLLRPRFRARWRVYAVAWLAPVALAVIGVALYFLARPGQFGGLDAAGAFVPVVDGTAALPTEAFVLLQVVQLLVVAPLVNSLFTLGEEFGWRGYLLPKLLPLGVRRALLAHGVVWGVWHWPIIAMGHNYGLDYPGAPWVGMLLMVVFTVAVGVVFGWLSLRSGSVWPAVLAHAMVNGAGGLGLLFLVGEPDLLLGPTASGVLGTLPWLVVAAWLLADRARLAGVGPLARA
ncbi:MAG: CPBP family intramembrane glutamic endopeptidase [Halobacteriales archaeon]